MKYLTTQSEKVPQCKILDTYKNCTTRYKIQSAIVSKILANPSFGSGCRNYANGKGVTNHENSQSIQR